MAHFGRQTFAESAFGAFEGNAAIQLFVEGLIDDAHSTASYLAFNPESAFEELTWRERILIFGCLKQGFEQEAAHARFPLDVVPRLGEQLRITGTRTFEVGFALILGLSQGPFDEAHYQLILLLRFAVHDLHPSVQTATCAHRATCAASCEALRQGPLMLPHP